MTKITKHVKIDDTLLEIEGTTQAKAKQVEHTALPWEPQEAFWNEALQSWVVFIDSNTRLKPAMATGESKEEAEANAAFIVKACNSHYQLVEALGEIVECVGSGVGMPTHMWDKAKQALAKAGAA